MNKLNNSQLPHISGGTDSDLVNATIAIFGSFAIGYALSKVYLYCSPSESLKPIAPALLQWNYDTGYAQGKVPRVTTIYDYDALPYIFGYVEGKREGEAS